MPDEFDPYSALLGIASGSRPLTLYRLLGIEPFESDADVIAAAANRRRKQLRQTETGPHRKHTLKLIKQVETARRCLINEVSRNEYDEKLRARLAKGSAPSPTDRSDRKNFTPKPGSAKTKRRSTTSKPQARKPRRQQREPSRRGNRSSAQTKRNNAGSLKSRAIGGVLLGAVCLLAFLFVPAMLAPPEEPLGSQNSQQASIAAADVSEAASSGTLKNAPPSSAVSDSKVADQAASTDSSPANTTTVATPDASVADVAQPADSHRPTVTMAEPEEEPTKATFAMAETNTPPVNQPAIDKAFSQNTGPFFDQHCIRCHGPDKQEGGLRIDRLTADLDDLESVDHYQNIIDEITVGSMPPEEEPQPNGSAVTEVLDVLARHVESAKRRHDSGGGKPVRRLAKTEYANTVYDLMGVHIDADSLQNDGAPGTFDTRADALYTTDMYFETHLEVARDAVRRFIASRGEKPGRRSVKAKQTGKKISRKTGAGYFILSAPAIPPAGHLIAAFECWRDNAKSDKAIFTGTADGASHEVLGTQSDPHFIERTFYKPKTEKWSVPVGTELGEIKLTHVVSPQPYAFFEEYRNKFDGRGVTPDSAAKPIIAKFAKLMSRGRTPDPQLIAGLNRLFLLGRQQGESFGEALVEPMALSMCTLEAMFHFEDRGLNGDSDSVSPIDLACRLSYFLWRSAPDSELIGLAQSGKLNDPAIRGQQVDRMMRDEKFDRFLRDFSNQWLELERQDLIAVDNRLFQNFDVATKRSMKEETIQFLAHVIREDMPLSNCIDSDFAMINNRMASHYGMPRIAGDEFRLVKLPANDRRGGLLTQAGILMQTGTGERSSIIERGVFIAKKMMNAEPPPPPPLVDDLPTSGQDFIKMTGAELVRKHAQLPQCASCHKKIDPMGLGLEEFDAIGLYRTKDVRMIPNFDQLTKRQKRRLKNRTFTVSLETKGALVTGQRFQGAEGLKKALMRNKQKLAKSYVEGLLAFANGRKVSVADKAIVDDIVKQTARANYPARAIVKAVVESSAFTSN